MLKKSLIGLAIIAVIGGGSYWGYSAYQAKDKAERQKVAEDIKKTVIAAREKKIKEWHEQRAEREKHAEFIKVHYPKVLNGTGTIEHKELVDENGVKRAEYQLVDGNIGGKYTLWQENGSKLEEGFLLEAKEDARDFLVKRRNFGEKKFYDAQGKLSSITNYDNSGKQISARSYYLDGLLKGESIYSDEGTQSISFYENGQLKAKLNSNGIGRHGWSEFWYANGVKKCEGEWDSSRTWANDLIGLWKTWDEQGNLVAEGYFSDNKLDRSKPFLGTEKAIKECSL